VRGDVIILKGGSKIPCDVIVYEADQLTVNNSSLTGEVHEISITPGAHKERITESQNICFFGTNCMAGTGKGICFNTGDDTYMGQIANMQGEKEQTTLSIEIENFIHIITYIAFSIGITFFILALFYDYSFVDDLVFVLGIIVANVPEGLLPTVTISLALTA
jgi:sodium/potassium-transporting ATPase subunit alpha